MALRLIVAGIVAPKRAFVAVVAGKGQCRGSEQIADGCAMNEEQDL